MRKQACKALAHWRRNNMLSERSSSALNPSSRRRQSTSGVCPPTPPPLTRVATCRRPSGEGPIVPQPPNARLKAAGTPALQPLAAKPRPCTPPNSPPLRSTTLTPRSGGATTAWSHSMAKYAAGSSNGTAEEQRNRELLDVEEAADNAEDSDEEEDEEKLLSTSRNGGAHRPGGKAAKSGFNAPLSAPQCVALAKETFDLLAGVSPTFCLIECYAAIMEVTTVCVV